MLRKLPVAMALAAMVGAVVTPAANATTATVAESPSTPGPTFAWPTSASANGRYLLDQVGRPYLISGDSPQGLFVTMSQEQAEDFFAELQRRLE